MIESPPAQALAARESQAAESVREIPLGSVTIHPRNPRRSRDPRRELGDLEGLAQSIRSQGVLEPIVVIERNGAYLAVMGSRRLAASRLAERATIPAIVREWTDDEAATAALTENLQREDLDPIERAQAYSDLLKTTGWTQVQLAEHIGKVKQPTIANSLRLLKIPDDSPVRAALIAGKITEAHALQTLRLRDPELVAQLPLDVTVAKLRERVDRILARAGGDSRKRARPRKPRAPARPPRPKPTTRRLTFPLNLLDRLKTAHGAAERRRAAAAIIRAVLEQTAPSR